MFVTDFPVLTTKILITESPTQSLETISTSEVLKVQVKLISYYYHYMMSLQKVAI